MTHAARAADLDAIDPLAHYRDRFVGSDRPLVYFDGNSLGRPLRRTVERLGDFVAQEWGTRLIRGWDERWFDLPVRLGDRLGAAALGAAPGQTAIGDSTTVLLYKMLRAAAAAHPDRSEIVVDHDNFPTDRYVAEAVADELGLSLRWIQGAGDRGVTADLLAAALSERTAAVLVSQVAYKSAYLADLAELTRLTHEVGAWLIADLCHSAGAVEVKLDEWPVDLAVGCTYKYLNGGPGAPAFGYVARRHLDADAFHQPIRGWMGAADPFTMGPRYAASSGVRRLLSGTPPITGMLALEDMVALLEEVGDIAALRAKSVRLTDFALALIDSDLPEVAVSSPRDPRLRGGHVTVNHQRMRDVVAALWRQDVLPDFREPDGLRIGLSPLSTSFEEVERGVAAVAEALRR